MLVYSPSALGAARPGDGFGLIDMCSRQGPWQAAVAAALFFIVLMGGVFLVSPLQAMATTIEESQAFPATIEIQDFGLYKLLDTREREFEAGTTAGYASVISTRHLVETTDVPLKSGVVFGFNFVITDARADGEWVPVVIRVQHPDTVNYLGKRSTGFSKAGAARLKTDGRYHNGAFYIFSESYEMVPGEWVISVIYRDSVSVSRRFTVR